MTLIKVRSLQSKILILFAVLLIVVQAVSFFTTYKANVKLERIQLNNTLAHAKDVFDTQFNNRRYYLSAFADTAAKDYGLKSVLNEDSKSFLVALNNHRRRINSDIALAIDVRGITFAELVSYTDKQSNKEKVKIGAGQGSQFPIPVDMLIGESETLVRLNGRLYQLSLAPIKSGNRTIGWLGFGYVIDNQVSDEFAHLTDVNVSFVLKGKESLEVIAHSATKGQAFTSSKAQLLVKEKDNNYITSTLPLGEVESKQLIAIMYKSKADLLKNIKTDWQQFFILIMLTLLVSIYGALRIAKGITRPIKQLIEQVKSVTAGNYAESVEVQGSKELKQLADEFNHMTQAVTSREETISYQAFHDSLTQLPNKNALISALNLRLANQEKFTLLQLSLLNADEIYDTLGYQVGDNILVDVAKRLSTNSLAGDAYHIGGHNFVLTIAGTPEQDNALTTMVKQLADPLMMECKFGSINLHLQFAIGAILSSQFAEKDAAPLLQKSSVALQQAIKNKQLYEKYHPSFDSDAVERLYLTNSLKSAIEEDQLVLFYQPKLALDSMQVTHVEALVRWQHPEKGLIPPDSFISIAEKTGQMGALTRWVTKEAFTQYLIWQRKGIHIQIAINISAQNLLDKTYSDFIIQLKQQHEIPDDVITLEVTEDAVVADPIKATELLNYLHEHGFKLSIDDYGTGYSSLAQLKQLPVQELKVDRSFVQQLANDESDQIIVKSSIEMAHNLGLTVVAEGIEDKETLTWLAEKGCELAQGYFISRPQPAAQLEQWLEDGPYDVVTIEG